MIKMKARYGFVDPGAIVGVIVALMILGVGVVAFFITVSEVQGTAPRGYNWDGSNGSWTTGWQNTQYRAMANQQDTGNSVFNIVGIVLIIGSIMSIVGLVYNYMR